MRKKRHPFEDYPYLTYWVEDWGEIMTTNGDYGQCRLMLVDEGGTCYADNGSKTFIEAVEKAEKYLREVESARFDDESIEALEAEYRELGLE
jgi:hypothetical protein